MITSQVDIVSQFEKWILEIQYNMMSNELFQPIGLETSCADVVLETTETYSFPPLLEKDPEHAPLAWNCIADDSIHIYVEHPVWKCKRSIEEKKAFLNGFRIFAEGKGGKVTAIKNEAEFTFTYGENCYTVKLIKHRPKKEG